MSVGRRGFLGLMAAVPVVGPEAAQAAMQAQYLNAPTGGIMAGGFQAANRSIDPAGAVRQAFKLGLVSRETIFEHLKGSSLTCNEFPRAHELDADLQAMRSLSLGARLRLQRERNRERTVEAFLDVPKDIWDLGRRMIANGLTPEDDRP
jgi:hypothetical protein